MTENYGLDVQDFLKLINEVSEYIIVDIRDDNVAKEEGFFSESFQIEENELPYDVNEIPSFFKSITIILVGDTPSVSSKWVNVYREQDESLTQVFYLNGNASDVFSADPRMKEVLDI